MKAEHQRERESTSTVHGTDRSAQEKEAEHALQRKEAEIEYKKQSARSPAHHQTND